MPRDLPLTVWLPPLIRTDFSDDQGWADLLIYFATERTFEEGDFTVEIEPFDDRQYEGMTMEELLELAPNEDANFDEETGQRIGGPSAYQSKPDNSPKMHTHAYLADDVTFSHPDRPVLAVNFYLRHGEHFRLTAASMVPVETNLSIGNLGFDDYSGDLGSMRDGVYDHPTFG